MSYQVVKDGLIGILGTQGLSESAETVDFKDASTAEYENTFILSCEEGESDEANEQQSAFLYDNQKWTVKIAYGKSSQSDVEQLNSIHRKKDALLAELDDPVNWRSFCTLLRYRSWTVVQEPSYFILTIGLKIKDVLTY